MATLEHELSTRQERGIVALLTNPSITEAAAAVKIGERTMFRWLQEPGFCAAYQEARRHTVSQAIARLQYAAATAVDTLVKVMSDNESPATARVSAAKVVLDITIKAVELDDMEARLTALEEQAGMSR